MDLSGVHGDGGGCVYLPCGALRPYVRYYRVIRCLDGFRMLTYPIACPQMIFHRGSPLRIPELGYWQPPFTVSGQVNFPSHIETAGGMDTIVVVFRPHAIRLFIDVPPSEFYNLEVSGYDFGNPHLSDMAARVLGCSDSRQGIDKLERWLLSRLHRSVDVDRVGAAVGLLFERPSSTVASLASAACLCKKQFERVFLACVGMKPKEFARIVRFQKVLGLMQQWRDDYAAIAYDCGYADQSHMIRDFKIYSGFTPKALTAYCEPVSELYGSCL